MEYVRRRGDWEPSKSSYTSKRRRVSEESIDGALEQKRLRDSSPVSILDSGEPNYLTGSKASMAGTSSPPHSKLFNKHSAAAPISQVKCEICHLILGDAPAITCMKCARTFHAQCFNIPSGTHLKERKCWKCDTHDYVLRDWARKIQEHRLRLRLEESRRSERLGVTNTSRLSSEVDERERKTDKHPQERQPNSSQTSSVESDDDRNDPNVLFIRGVVINRKGGPFAGGSFADVYRGSVNGLDVAVKRFRIFLRGNESKKVYKRFYREALIWQKLRHRHILSFLGVDQDALEKNGSLHMISPFMTHGTLMEYLGRLDKTTKVLHKQLITDVAAGLVYLHAQSLVHGDLHGSNVFIDSQERALLGDFGLTASDLMSDLAPTTTINKAGAIRWLSPELFAQDDGLAPRKTSQGDIFAFGRVCLSIFTRRLPFHTIPSDAGVLAYVLAHKHPMRPCLEDCHGTLVPDGLWNLMTQCWSADPSQRPSIKGLDILILVHV